MRILLTGASSFTGSWFAEALAASGHEVAATFRGAADSYEGARAARVERLAGRVEPLCEVSFGEPRFLEIIESGDFDLICHHGAEMADYRSWDFDPLAATAANTRCARKVVETLADKGGSGLIVTGTVFEPFEGIGDHGRRAFNPYGLSKHLSFELLRMEAERAATPVGKFVIPNPFGPREEFRFTSFLAREWLAGRTPRVATPDYVRDNIEVSLLALAYVGYVEAFPLHGGQDRCTPSGHAESQGAFAARMARELGPRFGRDCPLELAKQTEFPEPLKRVNPTPAAPAFPQWSQAAAWDDLALWYLGAFGEGAGR